MIEKELYFYIFSFDVILVLFMVVTFSGTIAHICSLFSDRGDGESFWIYLKKYFFFPLFPFILFLVSSALLILDKCFWLVRYDSYPQVVIRETESPIPYRYMVTETEVIEYRSRKFNGEWKEYSSRFTFSDKKNVIYMDDISIYENVEGVIYE